MRHANLLLLFCTHVASRGQQKGRSEKKGTQGERDEVGFESVPLARCERHALAASLSRSPFASISPLSTPQQMPSPLRKAVEHTPAEGRRGSSSHGAEPRRRRCRSRQTDPVRFESLCRALTLAPLPCCVESALIEAVNSQPLTSWTAAGAAIGVGGLHGQTQGDREQQQ